MRYMPHTDAELREMLAAVGVPDLEALFESIPEPLRLERPLTLPPALAEVELQQHMAALAGRNRTPANGLRSFLGAGGARHHVPAVVNALTQRGEFLTAYTPYQAEVAQGTLQAIFEFQTAVAELLGVDVANASMYDGATAAVEGALMGLRTLRKPEGRVALAATLHPQTREVFATYLGGGQLLDVPYDDSGRTAPQAVAQAASACPVIVVQQPNFFGCLEDIAALSKAASDGGALLVVATTEPTAFGVVEAPGLQGADVVCGEGQALGLPLSFGGPGLGLFGAKKRFLRAMPGRLVGETVDSEGRRGFVLTLATREQHIRRERATSNICTNHGLCALAATIYMSLLGRRGMVELAQANLSAGAYLRARVEATAGLTPAFGAPVFNELAVRLPGRDAVIVRDALLEQDILAGHPLGAVAPELRDTLLVQVTELHTRVQIDELVAALAR